MSEPPKDAFDACPEAARPALACYLAGEISAEVAIMQLLLALGGMEAVAKCLSALPKQPAIGALQVIIERDAAALAGATAVVKQGLARERTGAITAIREQFDRAVAVSPEAAVALYSLGSAVRQPRLSRGWTNGSSSGRKLSRSISAAASAASKSRSHRVCAR
jgi:hypothetical protein